MRTLPFAVAACLMPVLALPAIAALRGPTRLPSAVAAATPGSGSAPILSSGLDAGAALAAVTRKRPVRRARNARRDAPVLASRR